MKVLRFFGYFFVFVISFIFFLYWMFPYDSLQGRISTLMAQQLGSNVDVTMTGLKPVLFLGVKAKKVSITMRERGEVFPLLNVDEAKVNIPLFSLLFGSPYVDFSLRLGKGNIQGRGAQSGENIDIELDVEDFDLENLQILSSQFGLNFKSRIDGSLRLTFDQKNFLRSSGKMDLVFRSLSLKESHIDIGGTNVTIPDIVFAEGKEARLTAEMTKGAIALQTLKFEGGDIGLDIQGKIFLSRSLSNFRLNLNGSFRDSPKLTEALPVFFLIEKQKTAEGNYPLSITGPFVKPSVRIGSFTLPI